MLKEGATIEDKLREEVLLQISKPQERPALNIQNCCSYIVIEVFCIFTKYIGYWNRGCIIKADEVLEMGIWEILLYFSTFRCRAKNIQKRKTYQHLASMCQFWLLFVNKYRTDSIQSQRKSEFFENILQNCFFVALHSKI